MTAGRDAILNVYQITNLKSPVFRILLFHDEIPCCNANPDFSLIAFGAQMDFLFFVHSLAVQMFESSILVDADLMEL
jgi:hypothetical protein